MVAKEGFVRWFSELGAKDVSLAGLKGASLAEIYNQKINVPPGFVVTSTAYRYFIDSNGLQKHISNIIRECNFGDMKALKKASERITDLIENANMPEDLRRDIIEAYEVLDIDRKNYRGASEGAIDILRNSYEPPFVAVRASIPHEKSFAGQHETLLNVKGEELVIKAVKKVFASLYTDRAIYYRHKQGIDEVPIAVVIQNMIDSQKSGIVFSRDPLRRNEDILMEAVWGLGLGLYYGNIAPDLYRINRNLDLVEQKISDKRIAFARNSAGRTERVNLREETSKREVLNGHEIKMLAHLAKRVEDIRGCPQDVEFTISEGEIYVLQSRPGNYQKSERETELGGNVISSGIPASYGAVTGNVKIITNNSDLENLPKKKILVLKGVDSIFPEILDADALILEEGSLGNHQTLIARDMQIPVVAQAEKASEKLQDGQLITVDAYTGKIIEGEAIERHANVEKVVPTRTKLMLITDSPAKAKRDSSSGVSSIGLARIERVIAETGKHPVWYLKKDKTDEYMQELVSRLRELSRPFREIRVRTSDFRSDELGNLEGAPEVKEVNPLLGNHGIRFSLRNIDLLEAELKAIKDIADEYSDKKFGVLLPQVISLKEVSEVKKIMRGLNMPENVSLGVMIETPAAVQIINDLCSSGISFASIGPSDLTQYTLAVDKNNEDVGEIYDELDQAMLNSISYVIRRCKKSNVEVSLCWQGNSKVGLAKFLVEQGINSIVVRADQAADLSKVIAESEKDLGVSILDSDNMHKEEEDYNPGGFEEKDVPSLNEAIPVSSEDLISEKEVIEVNYPKREPFDLFERISEELLKSEIIVEIERMNRYERAKEVESQKKENPYKSYEDEILDIF